MAFLFNVSGKVDCESSSSFGGAVLCHLDMVKAFGEMVWSAATRDAIRVDRGDRLHSRVIYYSSVKKRHTNGRGDKHNSLRRKAVAESGCRLNRSDSRASQDGFRPLPLVWKTQLPPSRSGAWFVFVCQRKRTCVSGRLCRGSHFWKHEYYHLKWLSLIHQRLGTTGLLSGPCFVHFQSVVCWFC